MALREVLAKFNIDVTGGDKLKSAGEKVDKFHEGLEQVGTLIAGGLVLGGIKDAVKGLVDLGSELNDTSNQLNIDVEDLQAWRFAAKLNGVEAGEFTASLTKLQKNMADNAKNGAESGGEFQKLGVSLRDAKGNMRDTTEVLYDTGLAISKLPKGAEQTAAAMEVFGKAGKKLLPMFSDGEAGLKKYLGEVEALGGGLSKDMIQSLDGIGDQMDRLDMATTSAKAALITAFVPALTKGLTWLTKEAVALTKNQTAMDALAVGVIAVSATFAAAGIAALAPWLPLLGLFAATLLIVQDLVVAFNGGDSAIGRLLDHIYGKGSGDTFFAEVKKDVQGLIESVKELWALLGHDPHEAERKNSSSMQSKTEEAQSQFLTPEERALIPAAKRIMAANTGKSAESIPDSAAVYDAVKVGAKLGLSESSGELAELVAKSKDQGGLTSDQQTELTKAMSAADYAELGTQALEAKGMDFADVSSMNSDVLEAIGRKVEADQGPRSITVQANSENTFTLPAGASPDDIKPQVEQANQAQLEGVVAAFKPYVTVKG